MTKYTIKAADGTIHTFNTLKAARASTVGFSACGLRIINYVKTAAKNRSAADPILAAEPNKGATA
jgi:hypothetical protein